MQRRPGRRGQVGVNGGGGDAGVAEQDLHDAGVDAVLDQPCRVGMAQGVRRHPPLDAAATAVEAKVSDSTRLLSGASPCRLGNSQRRLRWVRHKQLRSSRTGCGSGTSRSLLPLPMMRNTWLARSMALTSSVVASLMRGPHAYMTARHVLWTGLRIPLRR